MADRTTTTSARLDDSAVQLAIEAARCNALTLQRLGAGLIDDSTYPIGGRDDNDMNGIASIPGDYPSAIWGAAQHAVELAQRIATLFSAYQHALYHRNKEAAPARHPLAPEDMEMIEDFVSLINEQMTKEGRSDDYRRGFHAGMREMLQSHTGAKATAEPEAANV